MHFVFVIYKRCMFKNDFLCFRLRLNLFKILLKLKIFPCSNKWRNVKKSEKESSIVVGS